uniref:Secreted protein n=1 Tax=Oryza brachyantha TaxID=4533 RepID=J3L966_ORYBR
MRSNAVMFVLLSLRLEIAGDTPAHPGFLVHPARPAEVPLLRRAVGVLRAHAQPLQRAPVPHHAHAAGAGDAEHLVAPLAGEEAVRVVRALHLEELAGVWIPGDGAVEGDVSVLAPVRHAAVLAQRHLLDLLQHVLVQPRRRRVVAAPVVGDVELDAVLRLAEVRRRGPDEAQEHAVVDVEAAERVGVAEVAQPLHVADEGRRLGQRHAEAGLEEERVVLDARVPRAGGEEAVVGAGQAGPPRRLNAVLVADHRRAGERREHATLRHPVVSGDEVGRRRRPGKALAGGVPGRFQGVLSKPAGLDCGCGGRTEGDQIVDGAIVGRAVGHAVVDPVDGLALAEKPEDVGELVLAGEGDDSFRQIAVVALPERHRAHEHWLQR